jgi:hypothetical protein
MTLIVEEARISETSVNVYQATRRNIPEDSRQPSSVYRSTWLDAGQYRLYVYLLLNLLLVCCAVRLYSKSEDSTINLQAIIKRFSNCNSNPGIVVSNPTRDMGVFTFFLTYRPCVRPVPRPPLTYRGVLPDVEKCYKIWQKIIQVRWQKEDTCRFLQTCENWLKTEWIMQTCSIHVWILVLFA